MPTLSDYRRHLQQFQAARLRRDHGDLAADRRYSALAEFFFEELYGPHDFGERDAGARRLGQFIHLVPGLRLHDIEQVLELLDLTNQLDEHLAIRIAESRAALPLDDATYERAYREADNYALRVRQLDLVRAALFNVHRVARLPLIGITLVQTRTLAWVVGMQALHTFLVKGHNVFAPIADVGPFCDLVYNRELARLDRIYALSK